MNVDFYLGPLSEQCCSMLSQSLQTLPFGLIYDL